MAKKSYVKTKFNFIGREQKPSGNKYIKCYKEHEGEVIFIPESVGKISKTNVVSVEKEYHERTFKK